MFDLSGKTALVTGASGGIGGAIARAMPGFRPRESQQALAASGRTSIRVMWPCRVRAVCACASTAAWPSGAATCRATPGP